jgi:hypothetical protein
MEKVYEVDVELTFEFAPKNVQLFEPAEVKFHPN